MKHFASFAAAILASAAMAVPSAATADSQVITITNDSALNTAVAQVRSAYLARHPYVSRLDVTLLLPNGDGTWRRGSYNSDALAYPASCVKLGYLAAAMNWCRENNHPYDFLDASVRPMIVNSDNYATGVVVDAITGAPNYSTSTMDATWWTWFNQRLYSANYLNGRGLLENQTIHMKTYPTNSGNGPSGAEQLAFNYLGGNRMQPRLSASLMLEIVSGAIEPGANAYMKELLASDRWGENSEFGFGLPPGTIYHNKYGQAYDTLEDIAHIVLPNGQEFVLAAYSNAFVYPETGHPVPYDRSALGTFAEALIEHLGLDTGNPPKITKDNDSGGVAVVGSWTTATDYSYDYDMHGTSYLWSLGDKNGSKSVTWNLNAPETGLYELCVWFPQKTQGDNVTYTVTHASGTANVVVDQTTKGGRWVRLGDFDLNAGGGSIRLTSKGKSNQMIMADAVKATMHPAAAPPTDTMSVADITMGSVASSGNNYNGTANVLVNDESGNPIANASVSGSWTGVVTGTSSGTTASNGRVLLSSPKKKNGGTFNFCVTNVTHGSYSYDDSGNVETCDSVTAP